MKQQNKAAWGWWLVPLALAAPFLGGLLAAAVIKGEMIRELVSAAVKLVVIP